MDSLLCDELVQEIFQRLPPSMFYTVPLVCKRWLFLHRTSKSSLSVRLPTHPYSISSFSSLLSRYPRLSSLTVIIDNSSTPLFSSDSSAETEAVHGPSLFWDHRLLSVASNCSYLRRLRFLAGPVSPSSLVSLSSSCKHLVSLSISSFRPFSFRWLTSFPSLKELFVVESHTANSIHFPTLEFDSDDDDDGTHTSLPASELPLESLCLTGIGAGDRRMGWLWRRCTKLRRLQLRSCEGTVDGASFSSFVRCLQGLQELELRTCRTIADGVLLRLAEHGSSLNSLLIYDGGSRDGLRQFIRRCSSTLQKLDLRLPLDLDNDHLSAVAENFRGLVSLRLQSCCLVTGEGLKTLGTAMSAGLEELALINCDVVEREPGLLVTLGQSLRVLRKLDLSHNEMLLDKEFVSMLVSCKNLVDIKLRGCKNLTDVALVSIFKNCKLLESLDILHCCWIGAKEVEFFVLNHPRLRRLEVEESKLSGGAKMWASQKFIEFVG